MSRSERLRAAIVEEIRERGQIPFRRFMERALYEPDLGYYTGPREKIGKDGDFYTSLDVHPVFGQLVAAQIMEMSRALPEGPYTIVEMGAGKGLLAHDILRTIQAADAALFARLRYVIVEVSPHMVARQTALLSAFSGMLAWHTDLAAIHDVAGVFLSNELVDSLPHHQVVMENGALREVFVTVDNGRFAERLDAPSTPALSRYFERLGVRLADGYRTEVNLDALDWMAGLGPRLARGHVLTIDYGYPADAYYRSDRKTGTFLCYHEHKVSEDPYSRVGLQDMTAHVDFSSLAQAGAGVDLAPLGFTDQAHFLVGLGITRLMQAVLDRDGGDPGRSHEFKAMRRLMDPLGMGRVFKVLIQEKGVHTPGLSGLQGAALSVSDLLPAGRNAAV